MLARSAAADFDQRVMNESSVIGMGTPKCRQCTPVRLSQWVATMRRGNGGGALASPQRYRYCADGNGWCRVGGTVRFAKFAMRGQPTPNACPGRKVLPALNLRLGPAVSRLLGWAVQPATPIAPWPTFAAAVAHKLACVGEDRSTKHQPNRCAAARQSLHEFFNAARSTCREEARLSSHDRFV